MIKKITIIFDVVVIIASLLLGIVRISENGLYDSLITFATIPLLIAPFILRKFYKVSNTTILIYSIHIFIAVFLGSILGLYKKISWFDTFAHTLFGFLFSFFALEFIFRNDNSKNVAINLLFILSLIALGAGIWETFEFTCDRIFDKDAQRVLLTGVNDTMKDMIVAYIGSLVFILFYSYEYMYDKNGIIKKFIKNI